MSMIFLSCALAFRVRWCIDSGQSIVFDRAPFVTGLIQSLKLIRDWVGEGIVPTDTNYDSVKEKFKRGEVAYVSGPWF